MVGYFPVRYGQSRDIKFKFVKINLGDGTRPAPRRTSAATTVAGKPKHREKQMTLSRRQVLLGSAGALSTASMPVVRPASAQAEPIRIGWLAALTGPSSAPAIGFNRGVMY